MPTRASIASEEASREKSQDSRHPNQPQVDNAAQEKEAALANDNDNDTRNLNDENSSSEKKSNLVDWDGPNDPENPKNRTKQRKWAATLVRLLHHSRGSEPLFLLMCLANFHYQGRRDFHLHVARLVLDGRTRLASDLSGFQHY